MEMERFYNLYLNPVEALFVPIPQHTPLRDYFYVYFYYTNHQIFTPTRIHSPFDFGTLTALNNVCLLLPRQLLCHCTEQTMLDSNYTMFLYQAFSLVPISSEFLDTILPRIGECARYMVSQIRQGHNMWAMNVRLNVTTQWRQDDVDYGEDDVDGDDVDDVNHNEDVLLLASQIADSLKKVGMSDLHSYFGEQCAICLEEFYKESKSDVVSTKCMHVFHKACIIKWLQRCVSHGQSSYSCPLCRSQIS